MPVIGIPVAELKRLLRRDVERGDLLRLLGEMGCDVEGYEVLARGRCAACGFVLEMVGKEEAPPRCDRCDADLRAADALVPMAGLEVVRMDLLAVRPDLFDPGGLARALRGLLSIETGPPEYRVEPPVLRLRVDDSVRQPGSLRPFIACAVLENVRLDDDRVKILMKLQENLHWALGRDRKIASIGVYDLDSLELDAGSGAAGDRSDAAFRPTRNASAGSGPTRDASGAGTGSARDAFAGSGSFENPHGFGAVIRTADLEYTTEDPDRYSFVPLGSRETGASARRTLRQILEGHPKGVAYAHLLAGFDRYPILRTAGGRVLSMPPIINSEETKVRLDSRRFFIDVTGTVRRVVHRTLNILVTSLLEMDPSLRLQAVELESGTGNENTAASRARGATRIAGPGAERTGGLGAESGRSTGGIEEGPETLRVAAGIETTPDLTPQSASIGVESTSQFLGFRQSADELCTLMLRMRHGVGAETEGRLPVFVPAWRNDILHERDLVEDAAIAYGYGNVPRTLVPTLTLGRESELERRSERARDVLIGLGLIEVMSLLLTSEDQSDRILDREPHPATVLLENPISLEQTQIRTSLMPGLLATLARNRHNPLPQGIFEIGNVTFVDPEAETGARDRRHSGVRRDLAADRIRGAESHGRSGRAGVRLAALARGLRERFRSGRPRSVDSTTARSR